MHYFYILIFYLILCPTLLHYPALLSFVDLHGSGNADLKMAKVIKKDDKKMSNF